MSWIRKSGMLSLEFGQKEVKGRGISSIISKVCVWLCLQWCYPHGKSRKSLPGRCHCSTGAGLCGDNCEPCEGWIWLFIWSWSKSGVRSGFMDVIDAAVVGAKRGKALSQTRAVLISDQLPLLALCLYFPFASTHSWALPLTQHFLLSATIMRAFLKNFILSFKILFISTNSSFQNCSTVLSLFLLRQLSFGLLIKGGSHGPDPCVALFLQLLLCFINWEVLCAWAPLVMLSVEHPWQPQEMSPIHSPSELSSLYFQTQFQ